MTNLAEFVSTRKLKGPESEPVLLTRKRIYILPTRHGMVFALVLFVMLLGSVNYNNSLGFALTFLLGSLAVVSILHTHRNLSRISLRSGHTAPVFAGQTAEFGVCAAAERPPARQAIRLQLSGQSARVMDVPVRDSACVSMTVPTRQRGLIKPGRFKVFSEYPLGLFRAWSWVELNAFCVVYPRPADTDASLPRMGAQPADKFHTDSDGHDDFRGLRDYQPGDSLQHIAWKRLAISDELLTKQFSDGAGDMRWIDWDSLAGLDIEPRLSVLCRWVLDAHADGYHYGLRIPEKVIAPSIGEEHKHRCLAALALFGTDTAAHEGDRR